MEQSLQMSLLVQTWRVVDVLAPGMAKDPRLDCDCDVDAHGPFDNMSFTFSREFGTGEEDYYPLEFEVSTYFEGHSVVQDWEYAMDGGKMSSVSTSFKGPNSNWPFPVEFGIQGVLQQDAYSHLSITDVSLKIPQALLWRK